MRERIIKRYIVSFKMQAISELDTGRFEARDAAQRHYDIGGNMTIRKMASPLCQGSLTC